MNTYERSRRMNRLFAKLWALALGCLSQSFAEEGAESTNVVRSQPTVASRSIPMPKLHVQVDPRVELMSLIFRLAGNPEYNQDVYASYTAEVDEQFGGFREHPTVKLARKLRSTQSISYDACMNLAVLLTWAIEPAIGMPLDPLPDFVDQRWTPQSASNFVASARQFVKDTKFKEFIKAHEGLYKTTESRMQELMDREGHLEWFDHFFGARPGADFTLIPGMLNGGGNYGVHCRDGTGREELFCILGVWRADKEGVPVFGKDVLATVVHEFCHSYANPIIQHHQSELKAAGEKLFKPVADQMRAQAYASGHTLLCESLVRASVVRYLRQYGVPDAAEWAIREEYMRGFKWMKELSDLLGQYEAERNQYPTLESFAPHLVTFFDEYANHFAKEQASLDTRRPKVVSIVPPNGSTNVDANLKTIEVVFDRPMRDGSWSMCGGGPHYPETVDKPHYETDRKTWNVAVKLKPDWNYEFWLNAGQYQAFQSEDGVPLESVHVSFTTAPGPGR